MSNLEPETGREPNDVERMRVFVDPHLVGVYQELDELLEEGVDDPDVLRARVIMIIRRGYLKALIDVQTEPDHMENLSKAIDHMED